MAIPKEFTPEITEDFYNRLAGRIKKRGEQNVGLARSEALARGLEGDPYEASAVGSARRATGEQLSDLEANMAYQLAGLGREERLAREGRDYESAEAQKSREFQERMARIGQDWQNQMADTAYRRSYQSALWQMPLNLIGTAGGVALGRYAYR